MSEQEARGQLLKRLSMIGGALGCCRYCSNCPCKDMGMRGTGMRAKKPKRSVRFAKKRGGLLMDNYGGILDDLGDHGGVLDDVGGKMRKRTKVKGSKPKAKRAVRRSPAQIAWQKKLSAYRKKHGVSMKDAMQALRK